MAEMFADDNGISLDQSMQMAFDRVFVGKNALSCFSQDVTEDPRLPQDSQIKDFCDLYANLFLETIKNLEFLEAS